GLLVPIYFLTRSLFDSRIAFLAAGIAALLPRAAEVGHDTLADSLCHFFTFLALWLGARALGGGNWRLAISSGLAAGAGFLARPESILVPAVIGLAWLYGASRNLRHSLLPRLPAAFAVIGSATLVVASYAMVKGEISEKIPVRV